MFQFKNSTTSSVNSYALHTEQFHGQFPLCFNSCLNSCRDLQFFSFNGRLFHKTLTVKFNWFIPYF